MPFLVFSNLQISGFYFIAGIRLLEKDEGTLSAQMFTPLTEQHYLFSKIASLSLITIFESYALLYFGAGLDNFSLLAFIGIIALSTIFILLGLLCIRQYDSLNEFIMPSFFIVIILFLPVFNMFNFLDSFLFYLHPMQGPLVLLKISIEGGSNVDWIYSLISTSIVCFVLFYQAKRSLYQISGEGL